MSHSSQPLPTLRVETLIVSVRGQIQKLMAPPPAQPPAWRDRISHKAAAVIISPIRYGFANTILFGFRSIGTGCCEENCIVRQTKFPA